MHWAYDEHKARMREAVELTAAEEKGGRINNEYAATLYLLTGMEQTWPRLKKYIGKRYIDCASMLENERLSSGEELIVAFAGNLFNGRTYRDFTPIDLIDRLDNASIVLVIHGIIARKRTFTTEELEV